MTGTLRPPAGLDITVVIPTIGRDTLRRCLSSIRDGSVWPAQVLVVHQGSDPAVGGWVDEFRASGMPVNYIRSDGHGAAAARNRGFQQVETPFVAATDDDCQVAPDWLERLSAGLRSRPESIVTGRVELVTDTEHRYAPSLMERGSPAEYRAPGLKGDPLCSGNMGFALATLQQIGPMDEHPTLRDAEDAEWGFRALRAGVPIVYAPEVVVGHVAWRDQREMKDTYRRYARSQGGFYGKYIRRRDGFIARRAVLDLLRAPWFVLRGLLTRNSELIRMGQANLTSLLPGILAGVRRPRTP